MKHGLITVGDYDIWGGYDISFCNIVDNGLKNEVNKRWTELMDQRGLSTEENGQTLSALFDLICSEFAELYGEKIPIICREGYITTDQGNRPVRHNDTPRIFADSKYVYIDLLMSSVLFDYAAVFYLWARFPDNDGIQSECFRRVLYTFDACCRKGNFPDEEGMLLLHRMINDNLDNNGIVFITDLYWCMIAFALCHEVAHIYLKHEMVEDITIAHTQEYEADKVGYDVFLHLMMRYMDRSDDHITSFFREYLYAAPMILMLFFHDLFSMGYYMYGERIGGEHPSLLSRIDRFLEISQMDKYVFDSSEGNTVLQCYWDVSDKFLEELFYKLKNGKLEVIVRKGGSNMSGKGFEEAVLLDEQICQRIREYANREGYDSQRLIGLWNVSAQISVEAFGEQKGFVIGLTDKRYSIKAANIIYNQKVLLQALVEMGLTLNKPGNCIETLRTTLYIIFRVALLASIDISDAQAAVLIYCHKENAYVKPIEEDRLLKDVPGASSSILDDLTKMGCIRIDNGKVQLYERVILS